MHERSKSPSQLLESVAAEAEECRTHASDAARKKWGQYFTSPTIAAFMAGLLPPPSVGEIRILDPGAGAGILGIAAAEHLIREHRVPVRLVSVEPEPEARARLGQALAHAREALGSLFTGEAVGADFLDFGQPLLGVEPVEPFDFVISNPPYFKVSPNEPRGGDAPNIYARFMEVSAAMLKPLGSMCFIVPRSFASGFYFRKFRRRLHNAVSLNRVHLFESRRDAFRKDKVLQENVIAVYTKGQPMDAVPISVSAGEHDLGSAWVHHVERDRVIAKSDRRSILFLPTSADDLRVMDTFDSWPDTLDTHGLKVSTGPVVPFRATEHVAREAGTKTVPMLWLQHVRPGTVEWPLGEKFRKTEHIRLDAPPKLLVPNRTYVLIRRFSAKEEARRLVAAPILGGQLPGTSLGLENHLNFIHRPRGPVGRDEARALATLLNSRLFDSYFRISNGNTQVSATELRAMPLPSPADLLAVAESVRAADEGAEGASRSEVA